MKIIFIFIDGLGLGADDPDVNPLCDPRFPNLANLLAGATPLDACLGVEGLPQSATGQATLLTGVNAAKAMGRHIEGFPPAALKKLIEHDNLFSKLRKLHKHCTFANSYWIDDPYRIPLRRQSVTTVMTLKALGDVRHKEELMAGLAVNHDITRWTMHTRGYDGPLIEPEEAAEHLLAVAEAHDFTLFEYFLTDRAGHSGDLKLVFQCLETMERFLGKAATFADQPNHLFLLCSDHGNIEDPTTTRHTKNPVPLVALGTGAERFQTLKTLTDVTPAILNAFKAS
ncbi:peptidase [Pontiella sulfatireligans]|uniref:2,3-bisphosphoglycerate-independent phosphoglycerate mutase n=1 Tax=Pontiella sulfatireligans TaxID=2750658 RepID=A0A6C2ULS2_9BACT|nr:peptidase [Pontiella sulfatireligans]VGO21210.1 2,3-bisphosphoglycerate-independent phosphoglycerate mutase [Pontiella sulfatireligans]